MRSHLMPTKQLIPMAMELETMEIGHQTMLTRIQTPMPMALEIMLMFSLLTAMRRPTLMVMESAITVIGHQTMPTKRSIQTVTELGTMGIGRQAMLMKLRTLMAIQ